MGGKRRGGISAQPSGQVLEPNLTQSGALNLPDTTKHHVAGCSDVWPDLPHLNLSVCRVMTGLSASENYLGSLKKISGHLVGAILAFVK